MWKVSSILKIQLVYLEKEVFIYFIFQFVIINRNASINNNLIILALLN